MRYCTPACSRVKPRRAAAARLSVNDMETAARHLAAGASRSAASADTRDTAPAPTVAAMACAVCKATAGLLRCPCRAVAYCGKRCQRADWREHKRSAAHITGKARAAGTVVAATTATATTMTGKVKGIDNGPRKKNTNKTASKNKKAKRKAAERAAVLAGAGAGSGAGSACDSLFQPKGALHPAQEWTPTPLPTKAPLLDDPPPVCAAPGCAARAAVIAAQADVNLKVQYKGPLYTAAAIDIVGAAAHPCDQCFGVFYCSRDCLNKHGAAHHTACAIAWSRATLSHALAQPGSDANAGPIAAILGDEAAVAEVTSMLRFEDIAALCRTGRSVHDVVYESGTRITCGHPGSIWEVGHIVTNPCAATTGLVTCCDSVMAGRRGDSHVVCAKHANFCQHEGCRKVRGVSCQEGYGGISSFDVAGLNRRCTNMVFCTALCHACSRLECASHNQIMCVVVTMSAARSFSHGVAVVAWSRVVRVYC